MRKVPTRALPLLAALMLWAVALGPQAVQAQGRPASVLVETVEIRSLVDTTSVLGQLVASTDAEVASRRSGIVAEVLFSVGDTVKAGDALARLDTTLTEIERRTVSANLTVAQAGIETAQARLELAEGTLARQDRLRGSTAFSRGNFEDQFNSVAVARSQLAEAVAQASAAEARLARVDYDLEHAVIRAPFSGVVVRRMAQPGQYVNLGMPVARLIDIADLEIEVDMPVELVPGLRIGTEVALRAANGTTFPARVRARLPLETIATRTRPVRFSLDLAKIDEALLAIGKSVMLEVPVSAPREIITVPKDALVQGRNGGWIVYAAVEGKAQPRPVVLGQAAGNRLEVIEGLAPGDIVVIRGNERLRPGQPVNPTPAGG